MTYAYNDLIVSPQTKVEERLWNKPSKVALTYADITLIKKFMIDHKTSNFCDEKDGAIKQKVDLSRKLDMAWLDMLPPR